MVHIIYHVLIPRVRSSPTEVKFRGDVIREDGIHVFFFFNPNQGGWDLRKPNGKATHTIEKKACTEGKKPT